MSNYNYYKISFKLLTEMLGTCTEASIWSEHIIQKAKKEVSKLNKLSKRLSAAALKYAGTEIKEDKTIAEIKGCIRTTEEALGKKGPLPDSIDELLAYAAELMEEFEEAIKSGTATKATVFMRGEDGLPVISTHMIIGNLKENLKIAVNNSKGEKIYKSKAAAQEVLALDVKPVEQFMKPNKDIIRKPDGTPLFLERSIRFTDAFGNTVTAIALSEQLPAGTEFTTVLRIRKDSLIEPLLPQLLDLGKSNGLGAWRGSGGKGSYCYKLEKLDNYSENIPEGWN